MRQTWSEYFMSVAETVGTRSTCDRRHVGAVIVRDRTILATGYNGSLPGAPHCDDIGHDMVNAHCVRTVHAELNAIAQAAKNGIRIDEAQMYITSSPCFACFKVVVSAGIKEIYYRTPYIDKAVGDYMSQLPLGFHLYQI